MTKIEQTLSDTLHERGITHMRDKFTETDGKRSWFSRAGNFIGRFDAQEGWAWIARNAVLKG